MSFERTQTGVVEVTELPGGYALKLELGSALAGRLGEFIRLEQACCPFIEFRQRPPDAAGAGRMVLEITGGPGVWEFLGLEFGIQGMQ